MRLYMFILAFHVLFSAQASAQTVIIGSADTYETGELTVTPNALQGFERALAEILCERGGIPCEWRAMPSQELLPALRAHEVSAVMAALTVDADLGDGVETTAPYLYPDPFAFIGLPGTHQVFGNVKTVAAVPDPAVKAWQATSAYNIKYFPTIEEALEAVEAKSADVALGEWEEIAPLIEANEGRFEVVQSDRRLRPGITMAFHSNDIDLRFKFEDLIYDMSQDGSLNELTQQWFGMDAIQWPTNQ